MTLDSTQTNKIIKIFNSAFASLYKDITSNFKLGFSIGAIVGLLRERTPEDKWRSDTIERSSYDKNSIYEGILRIINKEDGIPVFINSSQTIGNVAPALAYLHSSRNSVQIHKTLNVYNFVQKNIIEKILKGKPQQDDDNIIGSYCAGDGFKSENRKRSISGAMDKINLSNESYELRPTIISQETKISFL